MSQAKTGSIAVRVSDARDVSPLVGVSVSLAGSSLGAVSDSSGRALIDEVPVGVWSVRVTHVGYSPVTRSAVAVVSGDTARLAVSLEARYVSVRDIVVTPGRYAIMEAAPAARQTLTRDDITAVPQLGEDITRAVARLPGVTATDYSARFTVRGGEQNEVLVLLDGVQLYEPFHMKDVDGGALSIVDVAAVEGVDLMTGGFGAEYGDRASGVFDMRSRRPPVDRRRYTVAASLLNVRLLSEGSFSGNRGAWLLSARRGYMDLVLSLLDRDEELTPKYYDLFGKVQYQVGDKHVLQASLLTAGDDLEYVDNDDFDAYKDSIHTSYANTYGWLTLRSQPNAAIHVRTVLSGGHVSTRRNGADSVLRHGIYDYRVTDRRGFDFIGVRQDWAWETGPRHLIGFGFEYRHFDGDYYYDAIDAEWYRLPAGGWWRLSIDTTRADLRAFGRKTAVYGSSRFRFWAPLTVEIGVRYDGCSFADSDDWSPRGGLALALGGGSTVRAGWGFFRQSQGVNELPVEHKETEFRSGLTARHLLLGWDCHFGGGIQVRLDAYRKSYLDLPPAHRNYYGVRDIAAEWYNDRVTIIRDGMVSRGLELHLKKETGGKLSWWVSYSLAETVDRIREWRVGDSTLFFRAQKPAPRDQRHTLYVDVSYRPTPDWRVSLAWHYHTGWPYTEASLTDEEAVYFDMTDVSPATAMTKRYGHYSRFDVRVNRYWQTGSGRITAFVEVINVLDRKNLRCYEYTSGSVSEGSDEQRLFRHNEYWFGILPSVGISYTLEL